jgi:lipopolysaccharide export system ATP-binding protein
MKFQAEEGKVKMADENINVSKLEISEVQKSYRKRKVVDGVSLHIESGEVIGLLGPNGAGKTTTFYMVTGLVRPDAGEVFLDGKDITTFPMFQRARMGVGYLAQEDSVFKKLTVAENIMAILEVLDLEKYERNRRLEELLDELDIAYIRDSKAYTLSGGERRRTEIARALASEPKFLLLDEPFAGIDPIAVQDIQKIIEKLRDKGIGILITDHNARETLRITTRSYIMAEGRIRFKGTPDELATNPDAKLVYLGDSFKLD